MRTKLMCLGRLLLVALLEALAGLGAAALVGAWTIPFAYRERGYWAIGGEGLLMIAAAILGMWAADRLLCGRRRRKNGEV